jgi:hypothetical protein
MARIKEMAINQPSALQSDDNAFSFWSLIRLVGRKPTTRSPLRTKPLRSPAQSLDEMISDRVGDVVFYFMIPVIAAAYAGFEWLRYSSHDIFHPWLWTIIALGFAVFGLFKCRGIISQIRSLKLGRDGEKIVAECLDSLRKRGYEVLHDVFGGDFNVDHVLVGPTGVYAIETKTRRKSGGQGEKIEFDGISVFLRGKPLNPNPTLQAKANARWIRQLLKSSTGKDYPVTPVVLFPGWWVEENLKANSAWVLNPDRLDNALANANEALRSEDVSLAAFHLKQFIRSQS